MSILLRLAAGIAIGILFYGGLWYTVRSLPVSRHPVLLTLGSFWLRTLAAVGGLLFIIEARWDYALAALVGFTLGRFIVSRLLREKEACARCT